jgi:hypothetical protein
MQHVIGLTSAKLDEPVWPLDATGRLRFDSRCFQSLGYFQLLSLPFNEYAKQHSGSSIDSLNVMFAIRGKDLLVAKEQLEALSDKVAQYPHNWRDFLGMYRPPRLQPIRIEPLLFRSRAISLISKVEAIVRTAITTQKCVVYGSGVSYRYLCGINLPPGTIEYS